MKDRGATGFHENAAAQEIADRRWRDGVRCPKCDSSDVVARRMRPERRWPQWRCRACRRDFTALTATEWSGSHLSPEAVLAALNSDRPGVELSEEAACARRVVEDELAAGAQRVLAVLRRRPLGATTAKIAELAVVSTAQTRRALRDLSQRGWAAKQRGAVRDGHRLMPAVLWALTYTAECIEALRYLPQRPVPMPSGMPDIVPPAFWHLFWSGTPGPELRISTDGVRIAGALIGSNDPSAEAWALRTLPVSVLEELQRVSGYESGDAASLITCEIEHRRSQHA